MMTKCNYYDCGWCYAPDDVETSASSQSACFDYDFCPYLKSQQPVQYETPMTEIEELKAQIKALNEKVFQLEKIEKKKTQTLYELIEDWWSDIFTTGSDWDAETSIANLVDEISLWLPTEHDTNSYKWNECIRMIRGNLR